MRNNNSQRGIAHIFFIAIIVFIVIGFTALRYISTRYNSNLGQNGLVELEEQMKNNWYGDSRTVTKAKYLVLYRGEDEIYRDYVNNYVPNYVKRYKDSLVFRVPENGHDITRYNLSTGNKEIVISGSDIEQLHLQNSGTHGNDYLKNNYLKSTLLISMEITGDKLFATYGGYNMGAMVVVKDLNSSAPLRLVSLPSPDAYLQPGITNAHGTFFIEWSFGDSCVFLEEISILDTETETIGARSPEFNSGCMLPDYGTYLGFNPRTRSYIYAKYIFDEGLEFGDSSETYLSLAEVDASKNVKVHISEANFPKNVTDITYDDTNLKVYMSDKVSLFVYDIAASNFRKIGDFDEKFEEQWVHMSARTEGGICMGKNLIDHTTAKTIEKESGKCDGFKLLEQETIDYMEELDLPEDYRYELI